MQHDEKARKSLSQFREEILAKHDILCTRELLSTEDHLRFYLMRFWLDTRDWFGVWPMFLFFLLFVVSIYLLVANNLMVGNWGFLIVGLMFAIVSVYGTAKLGDLQRRQRKDDYLKAVRRVKVFLVAKAKDGLCMRKLIKLYSGVINRPDVSYSKDAVAIHPKPARLPKIEEHRLLNFIFVDLDRKSKESEQYFRDRNLFLGEDNLDSARECIGEDFNSKQAKLDETLGIEAKLRSAIPCGQKANVAKVNELLDMTVSDFEQLTATYFDVFKRHSGLTPLRIQQRMVMAATGWVIRIARENGIDLRLLSADAVPDEAKKSFEDLKAQAKMKWSLDDLAIEAMTPSKVHTFATGQTNIVAELKVFKDVLST